MDISYYMVQRAKMEESVSPQQTWLANVPLCYLDELMSSFASYMVRRSAPFQRTWDSSRGAEG